MNQDKKLRLLLAPLIFVVIVFVPGMILEIIPNAYLAGGVIALWNPLDILLVISMFIGGILFNYIPIGVYIAVLVVYTIVSWTWILRQKKGHAMYFIVWLVLCVLSIIMYWVVGPEYYAMMHG